MTSVDGGRAGRLKPETLDPRLSPRAKILLPLGLVLLVGFSVYRLIIADPPPAPLDLSGSTMGTTYSVRLDVEGVSAEERARLAGTIQERLDEVDGLMSTYDPDSELSRFNASTSTDPFPLSGPTLEVLEVAQAVSEASGGALDVTVGPLVEAWGFGASGQPPREPSPEVLQALLRRVGYRGLTLQPADGTATKAWPDLTADLSAVAKGYAADRVAEALVDLGYPRFLVEVGGELRAGSPKSDGTAWRVAIERPDAAARTVQQVIGLVDLSVATSGDYRNFYELEGVEYAHFIDPRTGRPARHSGASVSVVHPSAAVADAWATALSVLGVREGMEVAEREGLAALFITREGGGFASSATSDFRERFGDPGSSNRD